MAAQNLNYEGCLLAIDVLACHFENPGVIAVSDSGAKVAAKVADYIDASLIYIEDLCVPDYSSVKEFAHSVTDSCRGRTVIVVDDGHYSPSNLHEVAAYLKLIGANKTVLAVPVVNLNYMKLLQEEFDSVVALRQELGSIQPSLH